MQYLRQAYVDRLGFLPPSWLDDPEAFHLRSDDVLRTLQSAQALFEGLYPPETDKLTSKEVRGRRRAWHRMQGGRRWADSGSRAQIVGVPVVPFYVEDIDSDTMTYNPTRCRALNTLTAVIQNTTEFTNHIKTVTTPLAERASKAFGIPVPPVGWSNGGLNTKLCVAPLVLVRGWVCGHLTPACRLRGWCAQRLPDDAPVPRLCAA